MATAYELAEKLALMAKGGEDGTISVSGRPLPAEGYWVGGEKPSLIFNSVEGIDRGELAWWIGSGDPAAYYGVWVDSESGKIYFDAVTFMYYERYATALAAERGEIAIWDIANESEIRL